MLRLTLLFCLASVAIVFGHPAFRKEFDNIVSSNECLRGCMNKIAAFDQEISLMKNPDIQNYFVRLDEICDLISTTRECIDACKITSNPFALESVNAICQEESRKKAAKVSQCLGGLDKNVYDTCTEQCGEDYKAINDEVHNLTQAIQTSELKNNEKVNPIMEKTNLACGIFKCVTRCNVEVIGQQCGKDTAEELQSLIQLVMDTQRQDVERLHIADTMAKTIPPQCSYMYDSSIIFGTQQQPKSHELLEKAEYELVMKQLKLVERQDALIDRENQKLDLEMDLLSQKADQKKHRDYEERTFMFN